MPALKAGSAAVASVGVGALILGLCLFGGSSTQNSCGDVPTTVQTGTAQSQAGIDLAIKQVSTVDGVVDNELAVSMTFGKNIESDGNPYADSGDGGYGWFREQKYPIDWHPDISIAGTRDPVTATNYIAPTYRRALAEFNSSGQASLWQSNPEQAAETVARMAENPAKDYYDGRATDVHIRFQRALVELQQMGIPSTFGNGSGSGASVLAVSSSFGGCQNSGGVTNVDPNSSEAQKRLAVVQLLNHELGVPYAYAGGGANGPSFGVCAGGDAYNDCHVYGFDCSGLVQYVMAKVGIMLPRISWDQYNATKRYTTATSLSDLSHAQPGDLMLFTGSDGDFIKPDHIGIYIGDYKMINAPQSGELVRIADLHDSYWQQTFVAATDPYAAAGTA